MIDLRSDTVTKPTEAMRQAMATAEVGDDVFREDPTVKLLEAEAAEIFGKEAGLFVPSGTMGNQIAVLTHTSRGDEVILEAEAHLFYYEVGGLGALAGVQTRTVKGDKGVLSADQVRDAIRLSDIHFPRTSLICLENTHNRAGGRVMNLEQMSAIGNVAKEFNIPIHLDGARVFNAAVALNINVKLLTQDCDSVMFCLSKGLGAPVGSLLVGSSTWIEKARRWRKMLGGGMRQVGVLAAAGLIALKEMPSRLAEDHALAKTLAVGLAEIKGVKVDPDSVETNIVIVNIGETKKSVPVVLKALEQEGVKAVSFGGSLIRFVTHKDVNAQQIEEVKVKVNKVLNKEG